MKLLLVVLTPMILYGTIELICMGMYVPCELAKLGHDFFDAS